MHKCINYTWVHKLKCQAHNGEEKTPQEDRKEQRISYIGTKLLCLIEINVLLKVWQPTLSPGHFTSTNQLFLFGSCPRPVLHSITELPSYWFQGTSSFSSHTCFSYLKFIFVRGKPVNQVWGQMKGQQCQGQRKVPKNRGTHFNLLYKSSHCKLGPIVITLNVT